MRRASLKCKIWSLLKRWHYQDFCFGASLVAANLHCFRLIFTCRVYVCVRVVLAHTARNIPHHHVIFIFLHFGVWPAGQCARARVCLRETSCFWFIAVSDDKARRRCHPFYYLYMCIIPSCIPRTYAPRTRHASPFSSARVLACARSSFRQASSLRVRVRKKTPSPLRSRKETCFSLCTWQFVSERSHFVFCCWILLVLSVVNHQQFIVSN